MLENCSWSMYIDLVQVIRVMGIRQAMFNVNIRGPDERVTKHMKDLILSATPLEGSIWLTVSYSDTFHRPPYT